MKIYLFRHGETDWNKEGKLQGQADIPLNESGRELALRTAEALKGISFDRAFCSPLKRAEETARIILGESDTPLTTDGRLKEINFGVYEGAKSIEAREDSSHPLHAFYYSPENYAPPEGAESFQETGKRGMEFLQEQILPLEGSCENVLIVGHGALNRSVLRIIGNIPLEDFWRIDLPNCAASILSLENGKFEIVEESMVYYETPIFDTHAHYDDKAFDIDREALLQSLPGQGIARVVNIGASLASCRRTIELAEKYTYIYAAIGIHPNETGELDEESFGQLEEMCRSEKCVAVGEIGLDYYWDEPEREIQKKWFARQMALARKCMLPVVIHSRDAAKDTMDIMKAEKAGEIGGVVHCYSYTKETARVFLDMGFFFGIGGVLTFRNAKKLREAVEYIPMDRIVLETDCPYLAPVPNRGRRNSSLNLPYVVTAMAEAKGLSEEEVRKAAWENALRLYRMEK